MEAIRLLIADDHDVVRVGIRSLLEAQPGWQVVAEARNGRQAVERAKQAKPDVAVLDVTMPILDGLEATRQMKDDLQSRIRILILTVHESDVVIEAALDAGAKGCLLKSDAGRDLIAAVRAVCDNKTFFTPKVRQIAPEGCSGKNAKKRNVSTGRLTERQREVVQLLAEGKSNKEVAAKLGVSIKTAETHRANIMQRLEYHSISELVRYAVRNRIVAA